MNPNNKDNNKENNKEGKAHPSIADIAAYCEARGNGIDPERFHDYYAAQGWVQSNGRPLKDWQAAVRTWEKRDGFKPEKKEAIKPSRSRTVGDI